MYRPCNLGIIVAKRVGESIADVYYEYESTVELDGKSYIPDQKRVQLRQKLTLDRVARKEALDVGEDEEGENSDDETVES